MKIPNNLLDRDGYPTNEWIEFIKTYIPDETFPIKRFIELLSDGWWMPDFGFNLHKKYKGIIKLELHTGGWSGNEDVINAILSNPYLTHFKMMYVKWITGGHYYFEINCN